MDGLPTTLQEADLARRNWVIQTLQRWKLIEVLPAHQDKVSNPLPRSAGLKVIRHADTAKWRLETKYTIRSKSKTGVPANSAAEGKGIPTDRRKPNAKQAGVPV